MDIDSVKLSKLTPEERKKCVKETFCFHCRKKGHMASNCPGSIKLPKKPYVKCTWKEEKLPELKEIKDNKEDGVAWVSFRLEKDF